MTRFGKTANDTVVHNRKDTSYIYLCKIQIIEDVIFHESEAWHKGGLKKTWRLAK